MAGKEGGDDLEDGLAVCTIVAAEHVSRAEILAGSFRSVYPDRPFYVLVIDSDAPLVAEPIRQLALRDLPLKLERLHLMALIYNVTELATALKPQLLLALLERHDMVVYLDPDTRLYAPMDELSYLYDESDVLLTPHNTLPYPEDSLRPSATEILGSGIYNLGFIGVNRAAIPLLLWWRDRLVFDATTEPSEALFTDQRWMDFAPALARV